MQPENINKPRYHFSLRALFFALTLCAIFLGVLNLDNARWSDACRVVATLLIVGGLYAQVVDLSQAGCGLTQPAAVWRLRWEMGWRVVLGICLIVFVTETVVQCVYAERFQSSEVFADKLRDSPEIAWLLTTLLILLEARSYQPRPRTVFGNICAVLGLFAGGGLVLYLIYDWSIIDCLVQLAINGVELAQPSQRSGRPFYDYQFHWQLRRDLHIGAWLATAGLVIVTLVGWIGLHLPLRGWRLTLGILATLGLGVLIVANVWAQYSLWTVQHFRQLNPDLREPYYLLNLFAIAVLLVSGATAVMLRDFPRADSPARRLTWRRPFGAYLHERWIALLLIGAAALQPIIKECSVQLEFWGMLPAKDFLAHIAYSLIQANPLLGTLNLVMIVAAIYRLFWPSANREHLPMRLAPLPCQRVVTIWPFLFAFLFTMLYTLSWLSWVIMMQQR